MSTLNKKKQSIEYVKHHSLVRSCEVEKKGLPRIYFKYRNKIGLDVALKALKEGWKMKKFTMDELMHYAEICRVKNVIHPYVEALI
jgi:hypothetical protein